MDRGGIDTARERDPDNEAFWEVGMSAIRGLDRNERPALLISECQNAITNAKYRSTPLVEQVSARGIVPRINRLAAGFRSAGYPVIHCTIAAQPRFEGFVVNCVLAARVKAEGALVTGTPEAQVHDDIPLLDGDIVNERSHGMAPFSGTSLDAILRGHGVQTVVLAGVSTNVALPGAATEAVARAYNVVLAEDCTAGGTAETHAMQIAMHLPLLAAISHSDAILERLAARK